MKARVIITMNGERIYFSDQNLNEQGLVEGTNSHFQHTFKHFLKDFSRENTREYHRQIANQTQKGKYLLRIELADLKAFEEHLFDKIMSSPLEMLKVMEEGVRAYVKEKKDEFPNTMDCDWQVSLCSD